MAVRVAGKRQKVPFLDIFRFLCICAVITIHVTSEPVMKLTPYPRVHFIYYLINLASSFSVPGFLFLSGFVLFYNYEDKWSPAVCRSFFIKRFSFTLVPYLIWSLIYYVGTQLSLDQNFFSQFQVFLIQLLTGKNYTHLYYIIVILQFYLLFPVFMTLIKRFAFLRRHLIIIAVFLQAAFFLGNKFYLHLPATGSIAFSYILFYLLGAYLGLNYEQSHGWLTDRTFLWISLWVVSGIAYIGKGLLVLSDPGFGRGWISYAHFLLYYSYVTFSCLTVFVISGILYRRWGQHLSLAAEWGQASFPIYLAHPAILLFWRKFIVITTQYGYQVTTVLGWIASLLFPWIFYKLIKKFKFSWLVLGKISSEPQPSTVGGLTQNK